MKHFLNSRSKNELVRLYRAYCYFFDRELTVREFSAFLVHVIIDGLIRAGIFYSGVPSTPFSRGTLGEFAKLNGMTDRRLVLFKYLSSGDEELPGAVKGMLDDICDLISNFDFKQMDFDTKTPLVIDGEMLQWEGYFFKPYYKNEEYRRVSELLKKAGIFSSKIDFEGQRDKKMVRDKKK
jgi:hypothetical protein